MSRKKKRAEREEREKKEAIEKERKRVADGKEMGDIKFNLEQQVIDLIGLPISICLSNLSYVSISLFIFTLYLCTIYIHIYIYHSSFFLFISLSIYPWTCLFGHRHQQSKTCSSQSDVSKAFTRSNNWSLKWVYTGCFKNSVSLDKH